MQKLLFSMVRLFVHIAENKATYIYATYDGTKLTVDATCNPGVR